MRGPSYFSSVFLELQLTILTLSVCTVWLPLSSLMVTLRIRNVQTSSQKRYVSREPCVMSPSQPCPFSERMNRPDLAPVFPSEHVPHRRIPGPTEGVSTLKVNRALTLSCNVSAITRSNWVRTFMASCGSIRSSPINSSRASVRATPRLGRQGQPSALFPRCAQTRAAAKGQQIYLP